VASRSVKSLCNFNQTCSLGTLYLADTGLKAPRGELSQKCGILLLFGFGFTELLFLFDVVNLHIFQSI